MNAKYLPWLAVFLLIPKTYIYGSEDGAGDLMVKKCRSEYVQITNITVLPVEELRDESGNRVNYLDSGMAYLYIAEDKVNFGSELKADVKNTIESAEKWGKSKMETKDESVVGLEERSIDYIVFLNGRWILVMVYEGRVALFNLKRIVNRKECAIFVQKVPMRPILSEDPKIVKIFNAIEAREVQGKKQ